MPDDANNNPDLIQNQFLNPISRYYGNFTPENLTFNANLQEFAHRVAILCSLETGGKISSQDAYEQIKQLWETLENSKENLLDSPDPPAPDLPPE